MTDFPSNVYRLSQRRFDAIPGAPWVYWVNESVREMFARLGNLKSVSRSVNGINTGDNFRFVRLWWETSNAGNPGNWRPFVSGGAFRKWYGNLDFDVNLHTREMRELSGSALRAQDLWFREGITYVKVSSRGFNARWMPPGFAFSSGGNATFCDKLSETFAVLGILNSELASYALRLINPTLNFQTGDVERIPLQSRALASSHLYNIVRQIILLTWADDARLETTLSFVAPPRWLTGLDDMVAFQARQAGMEREMDNEVYRLYGISDADRTAIEAELAGGGALDHEDSEGDEAPDGRKPEEREDETTEGAMTREELAVRWISYAVGVVLGRFQPGVAGALGRAVYRRSDFAIGSIPEPDEAEFDELVGPPERFAYIDAVGGRHIFTTEVEQSLRDLVLPDGIAVFDEGHPRDLPALVEKALRLMLDPSPSEIVNRQSSIVNPSDEVIQAGANGDLSKFLEKDFFTRWHLRWYRKRPVYWPLQSAKRGYGFVIFHEKVEKYTLYVLLRDYLDHKLNGLRLQIEDLAVQAAGQTGSARRQTERQLDRTRQLLDEVNAFAQAIDRIAKAGYQPEQNWIDDGVILRLAPLWELIPIWKSEPKKYWERLEQGDFDWSHIAMKYWPERVREACRTNKSFAIAHGLD